MEQVEFINDVAGQSFTDEKRGRKCLHKEYYGVKEDF